MTADPSTGARVDITELPEHLHTDIASTIHQHLGDDGQSDEANDWVTDLVAALSPLIVRELVPDPQGADERAYWELVEAATHVVGAYDDPDDASTDDVCGAIEVLREHIPNTPRRERLARLRELRAVGAPDEPTDDDRPERGRWARLNEALDAATKPLREDFEWLIGEYERLRGSESALRRAFDVAQQAGVDLWAEVERLRAAALFVPGEFVAHSGETLTWKIECDALTDRDWEALALAAVEVLPPFGPVEAFPTGGDPFAQALSAHSTPGGPLLIADDVCTTGASLEEHRAGRDAIGVVAFARGPVPSWVTPLFTLRAAAPKPRTMGEDIRAKHDVADCPWRECCPDCVVPSDEGDDGPLTITFGAADLRAAAPASEDDEGHHWVIDEQDVVYWADEYGSELAAVEIMAIPEASEAIWDEARAALRRAVRASGSPPPTPDPRPWSPLVERFRSALMREHADDWDMETVSEAAHICAHVMALIAQPGREPLWRGKTIRVPRADDRRSSIGARLDVPPGTAVRVDHDHQSTESENHHGQDQR